MKKSKSDGQEIPESVKEGIGGVTPNGESGAYSENKNKDVTSSVENHDREIPDELDDDNKTDLEGSRSEKPEKKSAADESATIKPDGSEDIKQEEEALSIKYMRLAADFQNFRRRVERDKSEIYAYANEKIVESLLDVVDNFERALEHSKDTTFEGFYKGIELIFKQFMDVLSRNQVEEIAVTPETEFDTALHEAVMMEERTEPEGGKSIEVLMVAEVFKKGYKYKDKVIRHAAVKVLKDYR